MNYEGNYLEPVINFERRSQSRKKKLQGANYLKKMQCSTIAIINGANKQICVKKEGSGRCRKLWPLRKSLLTQKKKRCGIAAIIAHFCWRSIAHLPKSYFLKICLVTKSANVEKRIQKMCENWSKSKPVQKFMNNILSYPMSNTPL